MAKAKARQAAAAARGQRRRGRGEPEDGPGAGPAGGKRPKRGEVLGSPQGGGAGEVAGEAAYGEEEPYGPEQRVMGSVLKVICTHSEPNYSLPWQRWVPTGLWRGPGGTA